MSPRTGEDSLLLPPDHATVAMQVVHLVVLYPTVRYTTTNVHTGSVLALLLNTAGLVWGCAVRVQLTRCGVVKEATC